MIYNPNQQRTEPKTKPIFKVIKTGGSGSENSRKSSMSIGGFSGRGIEQNYLQELGRQADSMSLFTSGIDFSMPSEDISASVNIPMSTGGGFGAPGFGTSSFPKTYGGA